MSSFSYAQWTNVSGTNNYYLYPGNAGIGINSDPLAKLHVYDGGTGGLYSEILTLQTSYDVNGAQKALTWRDGANITGQIATYFDAGKVNMSFGHLYYNGYQTADLMTILGNGNVGINTSNPQGKLDIFSANNTANIPLFSIRSDFHTAGNYGMIRFGDYTQTTDYQKGALIYESVAGSARGRFHIALENTDGNGSVSLSDAKLTVLSAGNVGIGITDPTAQLHVKGLNQTTANLSTSTNLGGAIYIQDSNSYPGNGGAVIFGSGQGAFAGIKSLITDGTGNTIGDLAFSTRNNFSDNTLTERMRILANGNIAIGTADPRNYKLAVNGNMIATSVTVKLYANWPDYVFKPAYDLLPLSEVRAYIDKNQHLPEMPSEQEVAKDGINLGDMNRLLVKKVEELTLYLIDKDKQITSQQNQLDELKQQMASLIKNKK